MISRRHFLATASASLGTGAMALPGLFAANDTPLRVAAIGHTGRGNFGHGLETVWRQVPGAEIVGVADADPAGLAKTLKKLDCSADQGFANYREMLTSTRPEYVSVCPRHPDQHRDMTIAAIEAGARGVYVEKPFCRTPTEADDIVQAAKTAGAKVAIAHRNRYHPALAVIDGLLADGRLGRLLEIRGRGKGDRRGGGEDLWVLGTHVLNLIEYFGGAAVACSATVLQSGRSITAGDVAEGNEALGPLAGDEVHARYRLASGINASFDSIANDETEGHGFGLQLVGSGGLVNLRCDKDPLAHFAPGNPFDPGTGPRPWIPITAAGLDVPESDSERETVERVHNHVVPVLDLIDAATHDRPPLCDADAGRRTVEMVCAVFESHVQGGREVALPLEARDHPLTRL